MPMLMPESRRVKVIWRVSFFSRAQKSIEELITKSSWMLKQASSEIHRDEIPRIEKVRNAAVDACVDACNGSSLECAMEVLSLNRIEVAVFASYIYELFDNPANDK